MKILVVDDDAVTLNMLREFLEIRGFEVHLAQNPGAAIRAVEEKQNKEYQVQAYPTIIYRDGAGQSGMAHSEAAHVATKNNAPVPTAVFPGTESCRATLALVS